MSARHSHSQICSDSRRNTDNQTVLSSLGQQWEFIIYTGVYWSLKRSKIGFVLCQSVGEAHLTVPILSFQSNRKQSMNYGCIVENEETHEVLKGRWKNSPARCFFFTQTHDLLNFLSFLRSCIMWKSRAHLWVTSSTAASTSSPRTSFSTSARFSWRTSRTCCCESQLFIWFCGFCAWNACQYPVLIWFGCLHLFFFPPSTPWFLFPYTIISYPFDG